jgi:hypothetical protein
MLPRYLIAGMLLLCIATVAGYFYGRQHSSAPVTEPALASAPTPAPPPRAAVAKDTIGRTADQVDDENRRARLLPSGQTIPEKKLAHIGDETVSLNFRYYREQPQVDPNAFKDDNKSGGFFAPLAAEAAGGDDAAARHLYQALQMCSHVPSAPAEQKAQLDAIRKGYTATGGGGATTLEENLAFAQEHLDRCAGVTESMYAQSLELLRDAADRGSASAALDYAWAIRTDHPDEARQRLEVLWSQGHVSALGGLAQVAKQPLAYEIAADAQHIAQFDPPGSTNAAKVIEMTREHENKLRNETSPSEYNEAAKKAVALLRNPACCLFP